MIAGYFGGKLDLVIMQAMDVLLSFPSLILGLMVVAMLGPSIGNLIFAIALTAIPPFARIARAPTVSVKERDYIEACRALGYSHPRILVVHILPNIFPEILVMGSLWLATAIRVEASLSFIGLGVRPPTPTWGGMIREGFEHILDSAWLSIAPSIAILVVVFALNMIGTSHLMGGETERGLEFLLRSLELARSQDNEVRINSALGMLGSGLGEMYELTLSQRYLEEQIAFGESRELNVSYAYGWLACVHLYRARWDDVASPARVAVTSGNRISEITGLIALGRLRARRGDPGAFDAARAAIAREITR